MIESRIARDPMKTKKVRFTIYIDEDLYERAIAVVAAEKRRKRKGLEFDEDAVSVNRIALAGLEERVDRLQQRLSVDIDDSKSQS